MVEPLQLQTAAWALTTTLELALLVQLIRRKLGRLYPLFLTYLLTAIFQSAAIAVLYRYPDLDKVTIWKIAWGTQALVVAMRSLALLELNRKVLAQYVGIWALARRLFLCVAAAIIAYDLMLSTGKWQWLILNGIRALELAMAAVIVTMLLFARYYRVPVNNFQRALAVGFCLYSSFYVINYSLLEKVLKEYAVLWNFLGMFAFIASLLVWTNAATRYVAAEEVPASPAIPAELYGKLSSELNMRLFLLNKQLIQLLHREDKRQ
ncbi:MAG TPA: hypothetical protein VFI45_11775 [Candidatus Acidoferrum sp.]|nr:hypothetical protein [Candidatus Acidoferrum sp.]